MTEIKRISIPPEVDRSPQQKRRGGPLTRATLTMLPAALAAACSGTPSSPPTDGASPTRSETGIVQEHNQNPSIAEVLARYKETSADQSINIPGLQGVLTGEEYVRDDHAPLYEAAPVLEVQFASETGDFRYVDQTKQGLPDNLLYQLLTSLPEDQTVLKTAFELGVVDRIVIRQQELFDEYTHGEDIYYEYVGQDEAGKATIYVYLPGGMPTLSKREIADAIQHESLHGITSKYSLDIGGEKPTPEDLEAWRGICMDLRNIAVDDAEVRSNSIIALMEQNRGLFTDPGIRSEFDKVLQALKSGQFNSLQPPTDDTIPNFSAEVPECRVIGPWESFVRLVQQKYGNLDTLRALPEQDAIDHLSGELLDGWMDIMEDQSIFTQLSEGTHNRDPDSTGRLGHPYDNWSELMVSVNNVLLLYPEELGIFINSLPDNKRAVALNLVKTASRVLVAQIPFNEKFGEFHRKVIDCQKRTGLSFAD